MVLFVSNRSLVQSDLFSSVTLQLFFVTIFSISRKASRAERTECTPCETLYGSAAAGSGGGKYPHPPPPPQVALKRGAHRYDDNDYALIWELQSSGNDSGKGACMTHTASMGTKIFA